MLGGVDGELIFLPAKGASEGQNSSSAKSMNNNAPMIDATPLSSVYPSNVVENVVVFYDPSYREDEQTLVGLSLSLHPEASKKVAGEASTPLDVDSDFDIHEFPSAKELKDATYYHWVVAHVTPPSWKQHLREISIEQLYDIHDRAYIRQAVLNNTLNSRTRELISSHSKAKTSYDSILARELDKDMTYAELERKLILEEKKWVDYEHTLSFLWVKIKGIESERERLKSFEIQLLQEIDSLKQDRAAVVSKVIPDVAMKLIRNNDLGASEGRNSSSAKSMNNNAPMIDATPLSSVYPSNVVENVVVFDDPSYREDEQTLVGLSLSLHPEASKKVQIIGKRKVAGEASTPLDVDSNFDIHEFPSAKELKDATYYHWVVAHVTPPSWKQHLREISIEQLYDIHDRAYIRQAVLDNTLNSRTRELISSHCKAKTSYDSILARELDKDMTYAELERKCNEAL
nr:hypothetical protein [Tanacetum cinerariifolium]